MQTGDMTHTNVQLALYKFYVDSSDRELSEMGVTRDEILTLARSMSVSGYRETELLTIATTVVTAYRAGRDSVVNK